MHGEKAGSTKSYSRGGGARTVILGVEALLGELRRLRRSTVVRHEPGLIGVGVDGDAARLADRRARVRAAPLEARPLCVRHQSLKDKHFEIGARHGARNRKASARSKSHSLTLTHRRGMQHPVDILSAWARSGGYARGRHVHRHPLERRECRVHVHASPDKAHALPGSTLHAAHLVVQILERRDIGEEVAITEVA